MFRIRYLRPPGAGSEKDFLARCIHCGKCAQVCPYDSIVLATGFSLARSGTPLIHPQDTPCYLCMRCPEACPSEALRPVPPEGVSMGKAELNRSQCFVYAEDIICRACVDLCPLKGRAIVHVRGIYPVITEHCVGCGVCEHVCPKQCITTVPAWYLT